MKPTMSLRFVERSVTIPHEKVKGAFYIKTIKVLQQQWQAEDVMEAGERATAGKSGLEWRDVPLVTEE